MSSTSMTGMHPEISVREALVIEAMQKKEVEGLEAKTGLK
jgi:hypothetical protein